MTPKTFLKIAVATLTVASLASCGSSGSGRGFLGLGRAEPAARQENLEIDGRRRNTIWDALNQRDDGSKTGVNRYLWNASLEVLDFLPVQSVDPFSGVIVTGYGTPPGGGRSYRATIYVTDPALDARSLNVSIQSRGGPVAAGTQRAVEDAILTRARQLRTTDNKL